MTAAVDTELQMRKILVLPLFLRHCMVDDTLEQALALKSHQSCGWAASCAARSD